MVKEWTTEELFNWDEHHILHAEYPAGQIRRIMFDNARGVTLQDTENKEYIDLCSQLDCVSLGHNQNELVDAAADQMRKLPYTTIFFGVSHRPSIECAMKLTELTAEGLDYCLFTAGGSDSNETAFRIVRAYWSNNGSNKHKIISLYGGYHGVSFAAGSASGVGKGSMWTGISPTAPGFIHVPPYYCYRCMFGKEYPQCGIQCAEYLGQVIENEGPQTVAAFIAEPVIGAGGMIQPPPEYWPKVREICTKHDVFLIADEIKTGFCRTGKMFAMEHWGIKPDVMTMAKGITGSYFPFGAVALNKQIYEGVQGIAFPGFTYDSHPVGCAVATKAMEIYVRDHIADNAANIGKHVLDRLTAEFLPLPCVGNVNGLGLMGGIEIVADKTSKRVFDPNLDVPAWIQSQAFEKGLFLRVGNIGWALSDRVTYGCPLTMTITEADRALDILKPIIAEVRPN